MSELQKEDEVRAAAEEAERKRQSELHGGQIQAKAKSNPAEDATNAEPAAGLGWDSEVDTFFERLGHFTHSLSMSLSSVDFRTLSLFYRDHSVMEKRAIANRLQRKGMHAFVRALHANDYRLYQDSWQNEAEAVRGQDPSSSTK